MLSHVVRTALFALALGTSPALAQDGAAPALSVGDQAWTVDTVQLRRFADADAVSATAPPDTKVEVVFIDGDLVRVRRGVDFGWVDAAALTPEAPEGAATGGLDAPLDFGAPPQ